MASKPRTAHDGQRLVDVHHHCVLPEYQAALVRSGAADPSRPLRRNASPQEAIEAMGTLGIEAAIVNPLSVAGVHHGDDANAHYLCRSVSDALARFASAAPDKLGFFAPLPYPDVDGSLEHMAYALDALKAEGLILLSSQNGIYVGDKRMEPLLAEMNRRKTIVFVHPARPAFIDTLTTRIWGSIIEYTFETTRVAAFLIYNEFMKKYPDIRWILAHAGGCLPYISFRLILMEEQDVNAPAFSERMPEGARHWVDRFYFDTAISGSPPALAALMEVARPGHVMYGSDWPYIDRHTVELQHECLATWKGFSAKSRSAVYRESALALFPRFRNN
jgi:predicted TIM-barrel fold metal-dependent hydrolase